MALADWDSPKAATVATTATHRRRGEVSEPESVATVASVAASLEEMDVLIRQLADLEGWPDIALNDKLSERARMALANVPEALETLREAVQWCRTTQPGVAVERSRIVLCELTAGSTA